MKKLFLLVLFTGFMVSAVQAQTKSKEIAKVNQGNWSVNEFTDFSTGELTSVAFYLRDARYARINRFFHISFLNRAGLEDFLDRLGDLYALDEEGVHFEIHGYHVRTGKAGSNRYITISDNDSEAISHLSRIYFNNLCKALRKKGYVLKYPAA